MVPYGYEEVSHTADLALHVSAEDFYDMLRYAARGMYDLIGIALSETSPVEDNFEVEKNSLEVVLVDFLNELLYFLEAKRLKLSEFQFREQPEGTLEIDAQGYHVNAVQRHIKAVTFHNLEIIKTDMGVETTITFDI
jgi:SHS2 domain-containing protein